MAPGGWHLGVERGGRIAHGAVTATLHAIAPLVLRPVPGIRRSIARHAERQVIEHHVPLGLIAVPEDDRHAVRRSKLDRLDHELLARHRHG